MLTAEGALPGGQPPAMALLGESQRREREEGGGESASCSRSRRAESRKNQSILGDSAGTCLTWQCWAGRPSIPCLGLLGSFAVCRLRTAVCLPGPGLGPGLGPGPGPELQVEPLMTWGPWLLEIRCGPGAVRRRRQTGYQAASGLDRFRRPRDEWDGLAIKGRLLQETLCARGGKGWGRRNVALLRSETH